MRIYSVILMILTLLGIFILAHYALKYLRIADVLKQICRTLIVINFRLRGKAPTEEEVTEALNQMIDDLMKGD